MIRRLYEAITGQPWTTTRSATAELGPPPGALYADQLGAYTDAELIASSDRLGDLVAHAEHILTRRHEREAITAWRELSHQQRTETYWTPLPDCGCPVGIVSDEGHQEGCYTNRRTTLATPVAIP
jgi:hypothetical protein